MVKWISQQSSELSLGVRVPPGAYKKWSLVTRDHRLHQTHLSGGFGVIETKGRDQPSPGYGEAKIMLGLKQVSARFESCEERLGEKPLFLGTL